MDFFESCGFACPERKGIADFLQEVTSRKDQKVQPSLNPGCHHMQGCSVGCSVVPYGTHAFAASIARAKLYHNSAYSLKTALEAFPSVLLLSACPFTVYAHLAHSGTHHTNHAFLWKALCWTVQLLSISCMHAVAKNISASGMTVLVDSSYAKLNQICLLVSSSVISPA